MKSTENKDRLITELMDRFIDMLIVTPKFFGFPLRTLKKGVVRDLFRTVPRHFFVDQYYDFSKKPRLIKEGIKISLLF